MILEQHIEELRAELRNAVYPDERRETEAELSKALAELAEIEATYAADFEEEAPS